MESIKFEVTKMGERGQIVIPLNLREKMNLEKGEKFIVIEQGDNLIFKRLVPPSKEEVQEALRKIRDSVTKSNLTEKDIEEAVRKVRSRKNESNS